jgi:hypothetical protein
MRLFVVHDPSGHLKHLVRIQSENGMELRPIVAPGESLTEIPADAVRGDPQDERAALRLLRQHRVEVEPALGKLVPKRTVKRKSRRRTAR